MALQVRPESTQPASNPRISSNPSVRWGVDSADSIRARGFNTALPGRIYGCNLSCNRLIATKGLVQGGASIYGFFRMPRGLGLTTRDAFCICATFGSLTRRLVPSAPIGALAAGVASSASTSFSLRVCVDVPIGLGACRALLRSANSISSTQRARHSNETAVQAIAIRNASINTRRTPCNNAAAIIRLLRSVVDREPCHVVMSAREYVSRGAYSVTRMWRLRLRCPLTRDQGPTEASISALADGRGRMHA
jgi:hypothetical protein